MFVIVLGSLCSGKNTLIDFLYSHGFQLLSLSSKEHDSKKQASARHFNSIHQLMDFVTENWDQDFVIRDLHLHSEWRMFLKRPFVLVVSVDAPIRVRFDRWKKLQGMSDLSEFIRLDDQCLYGADAERISNVDSPARGGLVGDSNVEIQHLFEAMSSAHVRIINKSQSIDEFHKLLKKVDFRNSERLRPGWDSYFMELCHLAALRSNCMKRRVGCLIVRNKRVISTGYNGTPRGLLNCNEGGCPRCNANASCGSQLDSCLCIHAEENALLEAGRERVQGSEGHTTLYCSTCPCLGCTKKIIQIGIQEVVYEHAYGMDNRAAQLFQQTGVRLRQHKAASKWFCMT